MNKLQEPFSETLDDQHPVRWSPADGDTPAYLTLKAAVERLTAYNGGDAEATRAGLLRGQTFRTPFAFYMIDHQPGDQPCFCVGPWLDDEPGETPDLLEREHPTGSTGCLYPKPVR